MPTNSLQNEEKGAEIVVYFDGVCGLCNAFIDFLLISDTKKFFKYAPLQGRTAEKLLPVERVQKIETIVVSHGDQLLLKSSAALLIFTHLGGIWRLFYLFYLVPTPLRDFIYDVIARNRYRWFGKKNSCRLPTEEEKQHFLP